ncbi:MAG: CotH kinase family protein, partial [Ignavibacteria bacterium]|nr:CotH kinase family protein [Ignavibacteria bacterium]
PTSQILSDFGYFGISSSSYTNRYELKTEDSAEPWTDLISVIDVLNNSANIVNDLPEKVNLASVYKAIGADILFANMDSYTESGRNFYLYFNEDTKKMEWIIWDVNMSLGSYPGSASTPETISLTYTSSSSSRPLMSKIFGNSMLKTNYLNTIGEVFNKYFIPGKLNAHIDSIAAVIRPYVILDTKKQYTLEQFDMNIASDVTTTSSGPGPGGSRSERKPGIKSFITSRYTNVKTQLTNYGITGISQDEMSPEMPSEFSLEQNYPNPFNPETTISYTIPSNVKGETINVTLKVYDVLGNEVATLVNEYKQPGSYNFQFSIRNYQLTSGVYFYRLIAGNFNQTKKMILMK